VYFPRTFTPGQLGDKETGKNAAALKLPQPSNILDVIMPGSSAAPRASAPSKKSEDVVIEDNRRQTYVDLSEFPFRK